MSQVNFIVYIRENLPPGVKEKIAGWNLAEVIKQLNLPEGKVTAYGKDVATITETSNVIGARLKMILAQWCVVESYVEVHPKLNKNVGPLARGN